MHEHTHSKQGGLKVDRPQQGETSPVFVAEMQETEKGVTVVSEDGFGKQQPRTPAQGNNDQGNKGKEAAKGN